MSLTGYQVGGGGRSGASTSADERKSDTGYWSLDRKKRAYLDYLGTKREEIKEQQDSRRFVHGGHWTSEEIRQLSLRKQPPVYENITARKIRGVVGTLERLRQDPKAYPRTPEHEQGAELATAAIQYALEASEWSAKDPQCSASAAIDGIGGIEFNLAEGDKGDREIELAVVDVESFFYDPRSFQLDFSDARYMGVGKWLDLDSAIEMFPEHEEELRASLEAGSELTSEPDRDHKWFISDEVSKRIRLVDIWYRKNGDWWFGLFTGSVELMDGKSYFVDEKKKTECKYEMFSAYVDQDGDRYGLVRDLKPLNRELNMRRSKAIFSSLSRRVKAEAGAFNDVEVARRESARADGVVIYNKGFEIEFDDAAKNADIAAQFQFYESLRTSIENFGPNIAVSGEGLENSSGRAIALLQQAGLADLGPFIQSYRGWKIRVYRKMFNALQKHWEGERWIRVTDDDDITQFIKINGVETDPETGQPTMVNAIGSLDVDIILDEGPDEVNAMGDASEALSLLTSKTQVPPELAKQWLEIQLELAPIPFSMKRKLLEKLNPEPTPENQERQQLEMRNAVAEVSNLEADSQLKQAQAVKTMREASVVQPEQADMGQPGDHPMKIQTEALEKQASAAQKAADAEKKRAETAKIIQDIQLEPQRMQMEHEANQQKMQLDAQNAAQDRALQARQAEQSSKQQAKDSDRNYQVNKMKAKQKPAPRAK